MIAKSTKPTLVIVVFLCFFAFFCDNVLAQKIVPKNLADALKSDFSNLDFEADAISADLEKQRVTLAGNAIIISKSARLKADKIVFDALANRIRATGKVELVYLVNNLVIRSQKVELTGKFDVVNINKLSIKTPDNRIFYIDNMKKIKKDLYQLTKVRYLPCEKCNSGARPPRWEIKSEKAVMNRQTDQVIFYSPTIKLFSITLPATKEYAVNYLQPWTRSSGFLIPKLFSITNQTALELSYLQTIGSDKNLIFSQYSKVTDGIADVVNKPALKITYQQAIDNGNLTFAALGAHDESRKKFVGRDKSSAFLFHARGDFAISPYWNWGYLYNFQSDYYAKKDFNTIYRPDLRHQVYLTGLKNRNYFQARSIGFFTFNELTQPPQLTVWPEIESDHHFEGFAPGGDLNMKLSMVNLTRDDKADNRQDMLRLGAGLSYRHSAIVGKGHFLESSVALTSQNYIVDGEDYTINYGQKRRYINRIIPSAHIGYRYPLASRIDGGMAVFSPRFVLNASDDFGKEPPIIAEESVSPILQSSNLFEAARFTGNDLYEGGVNLNYGFDLTLRAPEDRRVTFRLGRRYDFTAANHDRPIGAQSGRSSDYILGVDMYILQNFSIHNSARLDKHNQSLNEYDLAARSSFGKVDYTVNATYLKDEQDKQKRYGQLGIGTHIPLDDHTSFSLQTNYDYKNKFLRETLASITIDEESVFLSLTYKRERNSLIQNIIDQSLFFSLSLKKLQ